MQNNKINDIILNSMQEQVYVRDLDMNIIYINPASEKLTGWTLKNALGQKCYDIFGDEKQTCKDVCPIEKMIADKMPIYHHEGKLKTQYGDEKDMKVSISPILENDSITGAVVVMNDITRQKEIEQTNVKNLIALSQEKKMFVKGPVVVFKCKNDPGRSIEYVSDNVENVIGYSAKEWDLQKVNYVDIVFKEDKQRITNEIVENSESGVNRFEHKPYRLVKKDGNIIWVLEYTTIIRDKAGDITHYQGYLMDITKAKQTHEKLKKSEARLKIEKQKSDAYINIAAVMLLIIDTDENITLMNKKGYEILGYNKGELVGKNWFDTFVPGKIKKELKSIFQRLVSGEIEPVAYYENQLLTKNGKEITVSFYNTILRDSDGNITGTLSSGEDITERKLTQEKINASLKEKVVLLREIHHRVKNNMQVIISLLRMHTRKTKDVHLGKIFEDCRDRINAMSLIHESLYNSYDLAKIDFKAYLKELCQNLSQAYETPGKGISLTVGECDVTLNMDQGIAIGMVIAELISNAFKHAFPMGKGGNVSINLSEIDAENVKLIIKDDGKGIPPQINVMNSPSLGLRLAVSAVTHELDGSIEIDRGKGTQFTICFKYKKC